MATQGSIHSLCKMHLFATAVDEDLETNTTVVANYIRLASYRSDFLE
jgi:hypothetical protein